MTIDYFVKLLIIGMTLGCIWRLIEIIRSQVVNPANGGDYGDDD